MERYTIVPYRYWQNQNTQAKASIFGACPWTSLEDKVNWSLISKGYTIRDNHNGTQGLGHPPCETMGAAQLWLLALEALDRG